MYRTLPFDYEKTLWKKGYIVIGVDEVGRGPLAGPIVAAAYAAAPHAYNARQRAQSGNIRVDDSKKLTAKQREESARWLKVHTSGYAVGQVSVAEIDRIGIARANIVAMKRAILRLMHQLDKESPIFVFSDYFHIPYVRGIGKNNQQAIIKGDQKCFSIAAASIIAKVYRDSLMRKLSAQYSVYGWQDNKGYSTRLHINALKKHGATPFHRKLFIRKFVGEL